MKQTAILLFLAISSAATPQTALSQTNNVEDTPCCCVGNSGNIDADPFDNIDIADFTTLIGFKFKGGDPLACPKEANVDGDGVESIDIADLTALIGYSFKGGPSPAPCIPPPPPVHEPGPDGEIICDADLGPPCVSWFFF